MKISYRWLSELVDLKGVTPQEVGERLTVHTAELEEMLELAPYFKDVYTGKVLSIRPHAKAGDKLSIAEMDLGKLEKKQIVYGSVLGMKVGGIHPVAVDGATLQSGIEIKNSDIRGEKSEGMVCINSELGMKNSGFISFPEDTPLGKPMTEVLPDCADVLFDIDNKSLTHRPDLMGHVGFAREMGAIFEKKRHCPTPPAVSGSDTNPVNLEIKTEGCLRFCAVRMENVTVETSPLETQVRLENLGTKAISNVVDITNIVMLEQGSPMHAFDAEKIEGKMIIRQAKKGEKILALDGEEYELSEADMVVADEKKALSIAGVIGGMESSVTDTTKSIVFECATWDPVRIRKTAARLGVRTESSMRYEKSLDPEACAESVFRAVEILQDRCPKAEVTSALADEYPKQKKIETILLCPDHVRSHSGLTVSNSDIEKSLTALDFGVKKDGDRFEITVPSFRATKDVSIPEDLIEEVVRMVGFEHIPATLPTLPIHPPRMNHLRKLEWMLRDFWSLNGFLEVYNYSFVPDGDDRFTKTADYMTIENPLSEEQKKLRRTLISGMARNIESEVRTHETLDIFELGKVYLPQKKEVLPKEILHLGVLKAATNTKEDDLFFALKSNLEGLLSMLGVGVEFVPLEKTEPYMHPCKCAKIRTSEGQELGHMAVLHPAQNEMKNTSIVFAEVDTEALLAAYRAKKETYKKLSAFPPVRRDISVVVEERALMGEIEKTIQKAAPLVQKVELFDEFTDSKKIGAGKKNLAFHLTFQSTEKTLEEADIDAAFQSVIALLEKQFSATLRLAFDQTK